MLGNPVDLVFASDVALLHFDSVCIGPLGQTSDKQMESIHGQMA